MVERSSTTELLRQIAAMLPAAFRDPGQVSVRVAFDGHEACSPRFGQGRARLASAFTTADCKRGKIEVITSERASRSEDRFLGEERTLVETVAELLCAHFDREAEERALRLSKDRLQQITDNMLDMVTQTDCAGLIRYVSLSGLTTYGYPAESLLGSHVLDYIHHEDRQEADGVLQQVFGGGAFVRSELRTRKADGSYIWIEVLGNPLRDDSGRIVGGIFAHRDVTNRRRAEEALRRSEAHFRSLIENASDIITVIDAQGTMAYQSPACERLTGFTNAELLGRSAFEFIHPDDVGRAIEALRCALANPGMPEIVRFRFRRRDGSYLVLEAVGHVQKGENASQAIVINCRDVTEREGAEERLRKLSRAVQQSTSSVVITDVRGDIEFINPRFTEVTGYRPEEVMGRNPRVLKSGVHATEFYRELWATISAGAEWKGELCNRKKSGELYWESATISPVRDPDGRITHFLAIKNDITVWRREQALNELHHEVDLQILDGRNVDAIMDFICGRLVEIYGFALAWYGVKELDGSVSVRTHRGLDPGDLCTRPIRWDDTPEGQGPAGAAIRTGQLQVAGCDETPCKAFREWAHQLGLRTVMVIPLSLNGQIVGTLAVYSEREHAFDGAIRNHMTDVATRMSVALWRAHDQSRLRLQGVALSSAPNAIIIADRRGCIQWANQSFIQLSGFPMEEMIGRSPSFLTDGEPGRWMRNAVRETVGAEETWMGELAQCHRDGHSYTVKQIRVVLK
jgi:PAS domain S-box-containing protein